MRELEWSSDLSVGIEKIDKQHKELFNKSNELLEAIATKNREKVMEVVDFLCDYVIEHFAYEEKIQLEYNYPAFEFHRDMHSNFVKKVYKFKKEVDKHGISDNLASEVKHEVVNWLINHICNIDKKLGLFLKKNSVVWSNAYAIGDENIDKQHKELFNKTKEFIYSIESGHGEIKVVEVIEFLQDYVIRHFAEEERLQIKYNYDKFEEHRDMHSSFMKEVYMFKQFINENGINHKLVQNLKTSLLNWINIHIKKVDKELAIFIKKS